MVAGVLSVSSACNEYLEIDPQQSLAISQVYQSAQDLETALVGLYDGFQHSDFSGCNLTMAPDIIADNGQWRGSFPSYIEMAGRSLPADNVEVRGMWSMAYRVINAANLILEAIPNIDDPELAASQDRIRGTALFVRGWAHFQIVRYFGKPYGPTSGTDLGVPIVSTATGEGEIVFPERATVEAVYQFAIQQLEEAVTLLPETSPVGNVNRWVARAALADIAFQQRDYARAAEIAGDIINNGGYSLVEDIKTFFTNEGSDESIWEVVHTNQDNPGVNGSLATFHHINGRGGDVVVSSDLFDNGFALILTDAQKAQAATDAVTLVDTRVSTLTSAGGTFSDAGGVNIEKYDGFNNNDDDAPIYRLATFMLMRAEALARGQGINDESINLLNAVRVRAFRGTDAAGAAVDVAPYVSFVATDFASPEELIEAIILERRVELCFEGNRLHDLKRLQRPVRGLAFDSDELVWPIPQRDLDANGNLIQNPGY